jgi:hypothetical protein
LIPEEDQKMVTNGLLDDGQLITGGLLDDLRIIIFRYEETGPIIKEGLLCTLSQENFG